MRRSCLWAVVVLVVTLTPAAAGADVGSEKLGGNIDKALYLKAQEAFDAGRYEDSFSLYYQLANKGHIQSVSMVGLHVMHGLGTDRNLTAAIEIFSAVGDQLSPWMKQELARAHSQDGNQQEATKWFQKAAEEGQPMSQVALAFAYYDGEGVPQNHLLAYVWSSIAVASGESHGLALRDSLAETMSRSQLEKAEKLASEVWEQIEEHKESQILKGDTP